LFYALDRTVTRAFLRHASQLTLQSGEHLYAEDEKVECISVVRSGSLVLYRAAEEEGTIGQV
jgi:CRP-like cAMP-binding protein